MKAPYECPPAATRFPSETPRRTHSSTAARAEATICSTKVSLGSTSPSPTTGVEKLLRMAHPAAAHITGECQLARMKR